MVLRNTFALMNLTMNRSLAQSIASGNVFQILGIFFQQQSNSLTGIHPRGIYTQQGHKLNGSLICRIHLSLAIANSKICYPLFYF
jgi:hypothetical protein